MIRNPPKRIAVRLRAEHFINREYCKCNGCGLHGYLSTRFPHWSWRVSANIVHVWQYWVEIDGVPLLSEDNAIAYRIPRDAEYKLVDRHHVGDDDYLKPLNFTLTRIDK